MRNSLLHGSVSFALIGLALAAVLSALATRASSASINTIAPPPTGAGKLDFGDAPDGPYPTTLKKNGARHGIVEGFTLGRRIDPELDGQPHADALGDDVLPAGAADDEDGVVFSSSLVPGQAATVVVTVLGQGLLNAWVDLNLNGSWADEGEHVFNDLSLATGAHTLSFIVPVSAKQGRTFVRFRWSHEPKLSFLGPAKDGEVEDYSVNIESELLDFGDAPELENGGFPTTLARNGARHHILKGFHLGRIEDGELNGQPNAAASGDDANGSLDDEDGVRFLSALTPGTIAQVEIITTASGRIDAWVDFNRNLSWADASERIFNGQVVATGVNVLNFPVPASAQAGSAFARFRFSREGKLNFDGDGGVGEVEDHVARIEKAGRCDLSCEGTDFWLTFPGNYAPDPANPVKPGLWVLGNPGTQVTVAIPGLGFNKNVVIPASSCVNIDLPKETDLGDKSDFIDDKGIHVTATAPVGIHGMSKVKFSSDGYLALPTEALGTEYFVLAYGNEQAGVPELDGTQFAIVATEPDTTVIVIPGAVTGPHAAGVPFPVPLGAGETYQLRASGVGADLTGTHILSDKPIGVFGGHACANVRSASSSFCDYVVEQLPPVNRWAAEFYLRRLATRSKGDTVRVLAGYDNTIVSVNGAPVATLAAGGFYETVRPASAAVNGTQITASRPVLVAQYANSSDFDTVASSDPFMSLVPGRPLFNAQQKFCVPTGFLTHHINVIAPTAAAGSVLLDGVAVGGFSPIGVTAYSEATKAVVPGVHSLTAAQPVGVTLYGWNQYESYGWPTCLFFGDTTPPTVNCPPPAVATLNANLTAVRICKAPVPDFRSKVTFTDNCPPSQTFAGAGGVVTQDPPPGTFVGPGVHEVVCSVADARGNVGFCVTTFTVTDPNADPDAKPVLHCPQDMVVKCADDNGAIVDFHAFATVDCDEVPLECVPPPNSLFPVGTTTVICTLPGSSPPLTCEFKITVSCAQISVAPVLNNSQLTISWSGAGVLQVADSPAGPWVDVTVGGNEITINTSESKQRFYRIK
ncbi:MAG: hypothetical protein EXS31_00075 [Pedosphaera sp.]|nr:hypothetical protein [Pedosphaera sp.]